MYSRVMVHTSFNKEDKVINKINMGELRPFFENVNMLPRTVPNSFFNCVKEAFNAKHKQVKGDEVTLSNPPSRSEILKGVTILKNLHSWSGYTVPYKLVEVFKELNVN